MPLFALVAESSWAEVSRGTASGYAAVSLSVTMRDLGWLSDRAACFTGRYSSGGHSSQSGSGIRSIATRTPSLLIITTTFITAATPILLLHRQRRITPTIIPVWQTKFTG